MIMLPILTTSLNFFSKGGRMYFLNLGERVSTKLALFSAQHRASLGDIFLILPQAVSRGQVYKFRSLVSRSL